MNNIERRDAGMVYISDESVFEEQKVARVLTQKLNTVDRSDFDAIKGIVKELIPDSDEAFINPPFYCDYGTHIKIGKGTFINYNCTILDVGIVSIGKMCQFGPNVAIYTAGHPIYPETRNSQYEYGIDVSIGDDCWIGGNSVICPGVKIGRGVVVAAGSVVTKDLPDMVIAGGNPCKIIREITEADRRTFYKGQQIDDEAWAHICEMGLGE